MKKKLYIKTLFYFFLNLSVLSKISHFIEGIKHYSKNEFEKSKFFLKEI